MNIFVWLLRNYWINTEDYLMADIDKELQKLNDDLLQICRLTQGAIRKTSGVLMCFDVEKTQEIIDNNKKISVLSVTYEDYFTSIVRQYQHDGNASKLISSSINVNRELKQISDLTAEVAKSLSSLNTDILDNYKINISQFAIIFQSIVWDSVISFLKQDAALAKKTIVTSLALKKICSRRQDELIERNKTAESAGRDGTVLLFIIQSVRDIATHIVNIAKI